MRCEMVSALNTTYDYINALDELQPDQPWRASTWRKSLADTVNAYEAGQKEEYAVWFAMGVIQGIVGEEITAIRTA